MSNEVRYRYDYAIRVPKGVAPGMDIAVELIEIPVVSRTPKGEWLQVNRRMRKWQNRDWIKRYAHETKEEALDAFMARRRAQMSLIDGNMRVLRSKRRNCQIAAELAERCADDLLTHGEARRLIAKEEV